MTSMNEQSWSSFGGTERLPRLLPDEWSPAQRELYDEILNGPRASHNGVFSLHDEAGRLEGPFNALVTAPVVGWPVQELGAAIRYRIGLTDRRRELAILAAAHEAACDYEWYAHSRLALTVGIEPDEVEAIESGDPAGRLGPDDAALVDFTKRVVRGTGIPDDLFARAQDLLGTEGVVELVVLAGYYDLLASILKVFPVKVPGEV